MRKGLTVLGALLAGVMLATALPLLAQSVVDWPGHLLFRQQNPEMRYVGTLKLRNLAGTTLTDALSLTNASVVAVQPLAAKKTVTTLATAGAETYTAAQLLGALILRDPNGAARTDTTATAALLVAAIPGAQVGTSFEFTVRNTADAAETITVAGGTGVTISGTATIAQNNSKAFLVRLDNVTAGAEAATAYSLGTIVH